uniref:Uncharacterized protein n=1 Tax=Octactis speculum TaxID=3111310 RepID=A0A7S2GXW7_9STRA|mmetsp:Transcript_59219/g.80908  ORF Transcript_59219/g.80908 Transcript_59219/m.80908 type:complete len:195 (+) Transcript_59219:241-825(+)
MCPCVCVCAYKVNIAMGGTPGTKGHAKVLSSIKRVPKERLLIESDVSELRLAGPGCCLSLSLISDARGWSLPEAAARTTANGLKFLRMAQGALAAPSPYKSSYEEKGTIMKTPGAGWAAGTAKCLCCNMPTEIDSRMGGAIMDRMEPALLVDTHNHIHQESIVATEDMRFTVNLPLSDERSCAAWCYYSMKALT